jgi:chromate transporter
MVSKVMSKFHDSHYVQGAMKTLRPASVGMVAAAILSVLFSVLLDQAAIASLAWRQMIVIPNAILFAVLLTVYLKFKKLHPIVILGIGAAAGIIFKL